MNWTYQGTYLASAKTQDGREFKRLHMVNTNGDRFILYEDLSIDKSSGAYPGAISTLEFWTLHEKKQHPLELVGLIKGVSIKDYLEEGILRIPTTQDGIVIWRNNEFSYEAPF